MFIPEFSERHSNKERTLLYWGDSPFVVSVNCTKTDNGFLADWWVSGLKWQDDTPSLILHLTHGLPGKRSELEEQLWFMWEESTRELCFASARADGMQGDATSLATLREAFRTDLLTFHLRGNERLGNFSKQGDSKAEKTANMYLMLKSFGSKQPQKVIADYESEELDLLVHATAINQRLTQAKKKGLLQ